MSTTAYSTVKCPVYVGYRCSKCGKVHHYKYEIKSRGSASQYGYANKSRSAVLNSAAQTQASTQMMLMLTKLQNALIARDFTQANIPENRCKECGGREPWMVPSYRIVKLLAVVCLISGAASFLIMYLLAERAMISDFTKVLFFLANVLTYGSIALFILYAVLKAVGKKNAGKAGMSLTDSELPLVGNDIQRYAALAVERFGNDEASKEELVRLF